jgi:deoxyribodipyrimidine photolyase-related protein
MHEGEPIGGQWNFDAENRKSFGKSGPKQVPSPFLVPPDSITRQVVDLVNRVFKDHAGQTDQFAWPVKREDALRSLDHFIQERLPLFGDYEDAMWTNEPWLFHAHISAALNLKLIHPREAIEAAQAAYRSGAAPLPAVEGFIRQILGWREYVRGMYWLKMPQYLNLNHLNAKHTLPSFYWSGKTHMVCLSQCIEQTLKHGYAHHIQRLMVLGLYTLMYGVRPHEVHEWFLSVFVDAVEWVELPNTLGMSQYGDAGLMASKPYIASGKYIQRMSNYCDSCVYDPALSTGERACPMTTLYWNFLIEHKDLLKRNSRMLMQLKNLDRLSEEKIISIKQAADQHRASV